MDQPQGRKPVVVFATRFFKMYHYFTLLETGSLLSSVNALNLYAEFDDNDHPRDHDVVMYVQSLKSCGLIADLIIIGVEDGDTRLYHNGIDGTPIGFVPYGRDYESLVDAIIQLIRREFP